MSMPFLPRWRSEEVRRLGFFAAGKLRLLFSADCRSAGQRAGYGEIVSAFQAKTSGQALCNSGKFYAWLDQMFGQIVGGRFPFDISAKGKDYLAWRIAPDPLNQRVNPQIFRANMIERR
jgi:hypothetical protein